MKPCYYYCYEANSSFTQRRIISFSLNDIIKDILQKIHAENVNNVFVDGSNLGEFSNVLKKRFPKVEISIFFHNIEARFFFDLFL